MERSTELSQNAILFLTTLFFSRRRRLVLNLAAAAGLLNAALNLFVPGLFSDKYRFKVSDGRSPVNLRLRQ